ncbi:GNAT family N-acetyltransferase [bacterium]|nr:GNAT family N-acetyltransferase [bacterium]MBU1917393.1 GNAT family N-acetyltransferase [bacterium]
MTNSFIIQETISEQEMAELSSLLNNDQPAHNLLNDKKDIGIFLKNKQGQLEAGLVGHTFLNWLYIKLLWVHDNKRKEGIGRKLVSEAERIAKERGCLYAWVDTFSFQAPEFYERLGYEVFGQLDDFPGVNKRVFYRKKIHNNT